MNYVFTGSPNLNFGFTHDRSGHLVSQTVSHAEWCCSAAYPLRNRDNPGTHTPLQENCLASPLAGA